MSKLLFYCGPCKLDFKEFDSICTIDVVAKRDLEKLGINSHIIFDFTLSKELNRKIELALDQALHAESQKHEKSKWFPLALQQVHWKYNKYYQYRLRLEQWIDKYKPQEIIITSPKEIDLCFALKALCEKKNIKLEIKDEPYKNYTGSISSLLQPYDLPELDSLDSDIIINAWAIYYKLTKTEVLFQNCGYLSTNGYNAKQFSWGKAITSGDKIFNKIKEVFSQKKPSHFHILSEHIYTDTNIELFSIKSIMALCLGASLISCPWYSNAPQLPHLLGTKALVK
ncbi:hypothetical protein BVY03_03490 [bacterium K02(2017)]|nr:hypothetical protein BVY03_03490 [bacterium K02(2017)]